MFDGIDTNVSHGVGIDVMAGQQVVLFGTEQALRRAQNSFGEAGMALHGHGLGSLMASSVSRRVASTIALLSTVGCVDHHIAAMSALTPAAEFHGECSRCPLCAKFGRSNLHCAIELVGVARSYGRQFDLRANQFICR